ncbi:flagellar export protein FliJ [Oceanobacillus sp. Castelsardo]|uniref:flagellar export protein FliJ n=1 Tax=Oceanobacillus sp. Castelsardo TaxID=1851204 RepID=UPI0008398749|nr:flagellar export protein FliJ [Oceanobacillus sp. Castelsardo]
MAKTMVLNKILDVRENEKKMVQKDYSQSMEKFESVAMNLYRLLKKKEDAEKTYEDYISSSVPLDQIKQIAFYIESIKEDILTLQQKVNKARSEMELKQAELTDAHIEVKKFEKLIERRTNEERDQINRIEKAFMDEISLNQFMNSKNR